MFFNALASATVAAAAWEVGFNCAATFVFVMERYSVLDVCLSVAANIFVMALALLATYVAARSQASRDCAPEGPSIPPCGPFIVAAGVEIVQALGIKRVATLVAVAGAAMALASTISPRGPDRVAAKRRSPANDAGGPFSTRDFNASLVVAVSMIPPG